MPSQPCTRLLAQHRHRFPHTFSLALNIYETSTGVLYFAHRPLQQCTAKKFSHGCPYACRLCSGNTLWQNRTFFRRRDPGNTADPDGTHGEVDYHRCLTLFEHMNWHQPFEDEQDRRRHELHHGGECLGYLPDDIQSLLTNIRAAHHERLAHLVRLAAWHVCITASRLCMPMPLPMR